MKDWFHCSSRLQIIIWAAKLLLLFIGIVTTFLLFKVHLTLSTFPEIWTSLRTFFLSPLYIYIIVNFIILSIAFSSTFQRQNHNYFNSFSYSNSNSNNITSNDGNKKHENYQPIHFQQERHSKEDNSITSLYSSTDLTDKTISNSVSSHTFEPHKLSIQHQLSIEKKPNLKDQSKERVQFSNSFSTDLDDKSAIEDTMEDTWRAIMEAQAKPKAKQFKKSETFGVAPRLVRVNEKIDGVNDFDTVRWARRELNKSETFRDRMSITRDKSMSQDELNRKVEAFINKFNNDIKLQRQESDQRFAEMINRSL